VCVCLTVVFAVAQVSFWLQWIIGLFRLYSAFPTQSGLSGFSQMRAGGVAEDPADVCFPWCLLLRPVYSGGVDKEMFPDSAEGEAEAMGAGEGAPSAPLPLYMRQLLSIPAGSALYDVYAIPHPTAALGVLAAEKAGCKPGKAGAGAGDGCQHLQRIGRLVSTSPCVWSAYDKEVFFKHQKKEDDYALQPGWMDCLSDEHRNIGSANIDRLIDAGMYRNFESVNRNQKEEEQQKI
jgi:hypothetical protein